MSFEDEEVRRFLPFDLRPVASAEPRDLDLDLFIRVTLRSSLPEEVLEENRRTVEDQLASLRFTTVEEPRHPTVLGVLVVGVDPRRFVAGTTCSSCASRAAS